MEEKGTTLGYLYIPYHNPEKDNNTPVFVCEITNADTVGKIKAMIKEELMLNSEDWIIVYQGNIELKDVVKVADLYANLLSYIRTTVVYFKFALMSHTNQLIDHGLNPNLFTIEDATRIIKNSYPKYRKNTVLSFTFENRKLDDKKHLYFQDIPANSIMFYTVKNASNININKSIASSPDLL